MTKAIEGEIVVAPVINQVHELLDKQGVSQQRASELLEAFGGPFEEVKDIMVNFSVDDDGELVVGKDVVKVTDESQAEEMAEAKEQRLALKRVRTQIENKRKELKEDSLKTGRAIDAVARVMRETIEPAEKYLQEQEKFKEILEQKRHAEMMTKRTETIGKYTDPSMYNLESMSNDQFDELVAKLEKEKSDREEAERQELIKQEAEARAERERQEKLLEENRKLQREAEERRVADERKVNRINELTRLGLMWNSDKSSYEGVDTVTKEQILESNEVKWKQLISGITKKLEAQRAEQQAEEERLAAEREAERKKMEELEAAEAKRKQEAEDAARRSAEAERQSLLAPDKDKIKSVMQKIEALKLELPATKNQRAQELVSNVSDMLERTNAYIEQNLERL